MRIFDENNINARLIRVSEDTLWAVWNTWRDVATRVFATCIGPETFSPIQPLSETADTQANPVAAAAGGLVHFFWLAKDGTDKCIMTRRYEGGFADQQVLVQLPAGACCGHLEAVADVTGAVWLARTQMLDGQGSIELLRIADGAVDARHSLRADQRHNQRPALAAADGGVWVVWDSFCDGSYDIYGCRVDRGGPAPVERISQSPLWSTIPALTIDGQGRPWVAWVAWQDCINEDSVFDQAFSIACAVRDDEGWRAVCDNAGNPACVDLRHGLTLGQPRGWYQSYRGRRRRPLLRLADDGAVWLMWERKAEHNGPTASATGVLLGRRWQDGQWSQRRLLAEGKVFYEVETGGPLRAAGFHCLAREVITEHLFFETCTPSPAPPDEEIDWSEWRPVEPDVVVRDRCQAIPTEDAFTSCGPYTLYWADLHNHSNVSIPPCGEPDELLMYGREKSLLGICAVTDNDHCWGGRTYTEYDWDLYKGWVSVFNQPGRYVVLPGYEFSYKGSEMFTPFEVMLQDAVDRICGFEKRIDHRSVYSDDPDMVMLRWREAGSDPMRTLLNLASEKGYLLHPHHATWQVYDDELERNVEVCSGFSIYIDDEDTYREALLSGKRVGFVAGGDNHRRAPGLNGGLTGIWAERLDRSCVLEALRRHRCFATAGERFGLMLRVNEAWMGESIVTQQPPRITVRAQGLPDEDYQAVLLRDEQVIAEARFTGKLAIEHEDADLPPGDHCYRVEIHGRPSPDYPANTAPAFRARAWSSPVWVQRDDRSEVK